MQARWVHIYCFPPVLVKLKINYCNLKLLKSCLTSGNWLPTFTISDKLQLSIAFEALERLIKLLLQQAIFYCAIQPFLVINLFRQFLVQRNIEEHHAFVVFHSPPTRSPLPLHLTLKSSDSYVSQRSTSSGLKGNFFRLHPR